MSVGGAKCMVPGTFQSFVRFSESIARGLMSWPWWWRWMMKCLMRLPGRDTNSALPQLSRSGRESTSTTTTTEWYTIFESERTLIKYTMYNVVVWKLSTRSWSRNVVTCIIMHNVYLSSFSQQFSAALDVMTSSVSHFHFGFRWANMYNFVYFSRFDACDTSALVSTNKFS